MVLMKVGLSRDINHGVRKEKREKKSRKENEKKENLDSEQTNTSLIEEG